MYGNWVPRMVRLKHEINIKYRMCIIKPTKHTNLIKYLVWWCYLRRILCCAAVYLLIISYMWDPLFWLLDHWWNGPYCRYVPKNSLIWRSEPFLRCPSSVQFAVFFCNQLVILWLKDRFFQTGRCFGNPPLTVSPVIVMFWITKLSFLHFED